MSDAIDTLILDTIKKNPFFSYLSEGYWKVFGKQWPPWLGGLLLGLVNFAMFAYITVWYIYDGFTLTGDWIISGVGIEPAEKLVNPWDSTGWVHVVGIMIGAFISTLMASDFKIRFPTRRIRLVEGFTGGAIMGIGAMLAPGCNIGGYFSAIASLSLSGFVMVFALGSGAYTGVLIARFRLKRELASGILKKSINIGGSKPAPRMPDRSIQPMIGLGVIAFSLIIYGIYLSQGRAVVGSYLLFGLVFGIILQRAGFCITASFRDLFITGGGGLARGMIVALVVAMLGFSVLIERGIRDPFVLPLGWRTFVGGYIFGVGMVIAGGCATGTLFRIGEGNVQLMLAFIGASISASLMLIFLDRTDLASAEPVWLVDKIGWPWAIGACLIFLFIFYLVVQWNEYKRRVIF